MSDTITATLSLTRWQGDRGTYHLVTFTDEAAEAISAAAVLHRLEFGRQRGFGSVKVTACIGQTEWKSSVFPSKSDASGGDEPPTKNWILLVSKKVMGKEKLAHGDECTVSITPV